MALDPATAAMLAFGGGLASAANPTRVPTGLGGALGGAAQGGLAAYLHAQDLSRQERLADLQQLETALKLRQGQQQRTAVSQMIAGLPAKQQALARAYPQIFARRQAEKMFAQPSTKAPTVKTFYEGGQAKQMQWDPANQQWVKVGAGPRWEPETGRAGGFSTAQRRFNDETMAARRQLRELGLDAQQIQTVSQESLPTGMPNPNYNPMVRSLVTKAGRRLYGQDDPGYEQLLAGIYGSGQPEMPAPGQAPVMAEGAAEGAGEPRLILRLGLRGRRGRRGRADGHRATSASTSDHADAAECFRHRPGR